MNLTLESLQILDIIDRKDSFAAAAVVQLSQPEIQRSLLNTAPT
ncbi:hypothetical protein [Herbaspirillum sp. RV1423]|nr:hypothetical protein [Herbaspirillum sp. RV1423]